MHRIFKGVWSNEIRDLHYGDFCVQYRYRSTPLLQGISPLAFLFGEPITLSGRLYAYNFDDADDAGSDSALDFFTRILVGGLVCSNTDANGNT